MEAVWSAEAGGVVTEASNGNVEAAAKEARDAEKAQAKKKLMVFKAAHAEQGRSAAATPNKAGTKPRTPRVPSARRPSNAPSRSGSSGRFEENAGDGGGEGALAVKSVELSIAKEA